MSATDAIVTLLCASMILAGIATIRLSRKQRGWGAIAAVIGLLAYVTADQGAPPPNSTPTHGLIATDTPTEDAP